MNNVLNLRRLATVAVCVALLGQVAYASPEDSKAQGLQEKAGVFAASETALTANADVTKITMGTVTDGPLNVRQAPGTGKAILGKLYAGETITIVKSENGWHSIQTGRVSGWVSGDFVGNIKTISQAEYNALQESTAAKAGNVVAFAKQQLGKPYFYGSSGPSSFDCSGLMRYVYGNFGVNVPRVSSSFASIGTPVSVGTIQPGDIITMDTSGAINGGISHVGMYVGNGQMVHAATGGKGVVLDNIYSAYYAPRIVNVVRVL